MGKSLVHLCDRLVAALEELLGKLVRYTGHLGNARTVQQGHVMGGGVEEISLETRISVKSIALRVFRRYVKYYPLMARYNLNGFVRLNVDIERTTDPVAVEF